MSNPTLIRTTDGIGIDPHEVTCEGCGSEMSEHTCAGGEAPAPVVVRTRSTGPRKKPEDHPLCPHCGGRIHFSMSGTAVNAECIVRQFALDTGLMTDPHSRLPVLTIEMMKDITTWADSLSVPPTYGKMDSASGGAGTYSGLKPKTGRKKKLAPAPTGSKIEDIAAEIVSEEDAQAFLTAIESEPTATQDEAPSEEQIETPAVDTEEAAREKRRQQRAARKAKLAGIR